MRLIVAARRGFKANVWLMLMLKTAPMVGLGMFIWAVAAGSRYALVLGPLTLVAAVFGGMPGMTLTQLTHRYDVQDREDSIS